MMRGRSSLVIFLGLGAACVGMSLYYYRRFPDTVASHFGANGLPDGWMSKPAFFAFYLAIVGLCTAMFLGIHFGLPRLPVSMINLPNKDYWLAPERRQQAFDFLRYYFLWFASAMMALLVDMLYQTAQVNLGHTQTLPHAWLSMGMFLCFSVIWIIGLVIKFRKPAGA